MLSFLSSWVPIPFSPFELLTLISSIIFHTVNVFVEIGGKKDLILTTLLFSSECPSLRDSICSHHSVSTSMWMSTNLPQKHFSRMYCL